MRFRLRGFSRTAHEVFVSVDFQGLPMRLFVPRDRDGFSRTAHEVLSP